jgi:hypothetical protein
MDTDVTVVATAAISAAAAVGGAWIGLLAGRQQSKSEDARQRAVRAQTRRDERKAAYGVATDLIADWLWDAENPRPDYDVIQSFTKPFVHAANAVRIYGSDDALAAIDRFQNALVGVNQLNDNPNPTDADTKEVWDEVNAALSAFFDAARADVGPAGEDLAKIVRAPETATE